MSKQRHSVKSVFDAAVEIESPAERSEYLGRACGDDQDLRQKVEALLAAYQNAESFLESPPAAFAATIIEPQITEHPGAVIGPYKLLEQIGEGGFGIVYMADQQAPVRRRVALKIIKPGMDTRQVLARFKAEQHALALMDHPNIARVLDAGSTDSGRPYFVMELIRGVPITDYCDKNNLPVHERLDLFVNVCHAVQHAHQKGIIHRDIKPSNVLITLNDGRPVAKVIDFGVAKALNQQLTPETVFTRFAEMIGTPLYMSPEQAEMSSLDIDTRSDVYSLGVLLYELLTGSTPLHKDRLRQAAYDEIRRIIREEEPPKPSLRISTLGDTRTAVAANRQIDPHRLSQLVRGDLDWIVMKAIEKDRTHRYDTASNFAADVLRYLSDQPIEARPPSAVYRLGKFARRNRVAFTTAMVVLSAILLGTVVSVTQAVRATRAERLAQTRLQAETEARDEAEVARRTAEAARQAEATQRKIAEARRTESEAARRAESAQRQVAEAQKSEAEKMRQIAESGRAEVTRQRDVAARQLYVLQMNRAEKAWDDNHVGRARELLESQLPEHTGGVDLRGWEWHYLWRITHTELRKIDFAARSMAVSADAQLLVSGGYDGVLKIWDAAGTRELRSINADEGPIRRVAVTKDGKLIATGSGGDRPVKLWETATGRELQTFRGTFSGWALGSDGRELAVVSNGVITIFDTSHGKELRTFKVDRDGVTGLVFSPDGTRLACVCGAQTKTLKLLDATTGRELWVFSGHKSQVRAAAFSPDGKRVVSGDREGKLKCLDAQTGREIAQLAGHERLINSLAFNCDGTRIASVGDDTPVKTWDAASGAEIETLKGHDHILAAVAFSPRGDVVISGGPDGIRFWDAASRQEPSLFNCGGGVWDLAYSGDGKRLAVGGDFVGVCDASTGELLWGEDNEPITHVIGFPNANLRFDRTGRVLASGMDDGSVRLRDARDGRVLRTLKASHAFVTCLDLSPDGRVLATGTWGRLSLWNALDGRLLATLHAHPDAVVTGVAFSPDGKLLASSGGTNDRTVRLWEVSTARVVRTLLLPSFAPSVGQRVGESDDKNYEPACIVFSRDGRQIFAGIRDNIICAWDVETGKTTRVYRERDQGGGLRGLALSPDGRRLVSCSTDQVKVWDIVTGQELHSFHVPKSDAFGPVFREIKSVALSPDGTRLAAGGGNSSQILVWDARPLTDELRAELNEVNLVESLFAKYQLSTKVIAALKADNAISESVRNRAIDRARKRSTSPLHLFVLGAHFDSNNRLSEAEEAYRKGLQVLRTAPVADRATDLYWIDRFYRSLVHVLQEGKRPKDAADVIREWLGLHRKMCDSLPADPAHCLALARLYTSVVLELNDEKHLPQEAEKVGREGLAVVEKLIAQFPKEPQLRRQLADLIHALGKTQSRSAEAVRIFNDEVAIRRKLEAEIGANPAERIQLSNSYFDLAPALRRSGQGEKALEAWRRGLEIEEKLAADFPENTDYRILQAGTHSALGSTLLLLGRLKEVEPHYTKAVELVSDEGLGEYLANACNGLAWFLATCPEVTLRDPPRAVELAKKAIEQDAKQRAKQRGVATAPPPPTYLRTLATAYYRAGNWKAALEAFEKSMQLGSGGDSFDWFFLAMAHERLGHKDEARTWHAKAIEWMDKNAPKATDELRRFRAEAEELLAPKQTPVQTTKQENKPAK